jgi:hypothetical protein
LYDFINECVIVCEFVCVIVGEFVVEVAVDVAVDDTKRMIEGSKTDYN